MHGSGGQMDGDVAGFVFWFLYVCGSLVVALYAVRLAQIRNEQREKARERERKRQNEKE
jgi:hypothetical protein